MIEVDVFTDEDDWVLYGYCFRDFFGNANANALGYNGHPEGRNCYWELDQLDVEGGCTDFLRH